jgi:DNA-binding transcriptional regulator YhcF (GntR family)
MRISIDASSDVPPFEQLRTEVAGQASSGELPAGTKLPTVRALATELGLAANTVARAYKELEADGVVVTQGRRGTFVGSRTLAGGFDDGLVTAYVAAARRAGLTLPEAVGLVERAWPR